MSLSRENMDINEAIRKRLMYTFPQIKYSDNSKNDESPCQWYFDWTSITYDAYSSNYIIGGRVWKNFGNKACSEVSVEILERAKSDGIAVERSEKADKTVGGSWYQELSVYFVDLRIKYEKNERILKEIKLEEEE